MWAQTKVTTDNKSQEVLKDYRYEWEEKWIPKVFLVYTISALTAD